MYVSYEKKDLDKSLTIYSSDAVYLDSGLVCVVQRKTDDLPIDRTLAVDLSALRSPETVGTINNRVFYRVKAIVAADNSQSSCSAQRCKLPPSNSRFRPEDTVFIPWNFCKALKSCQCLTS